MLRVLENILGRMHVRYHICVKGHLDASWQQWFAPLQIRLEPLGTTVLSGVLPDQAALYGMLLKLDRLGITLLAVESGEEPLDPGQGPDQT
jgi:hypothetical protein